MVLGAGTISIGGIRVVSLFEREEKGRICGEMVPPREAVLESEGD